MERRCGNCVFGAIAYDNQGNEDPRYVICQIKESENRQRRPDRFHLTSSVSRMHINREACLQFRQLEMPSSSQSVPTQTVQELHVPTTYDVHSSPPAATAPPVANNEALEQEIKDLKLLLIQKDQMILSLQNQVHHLSEELQREQGDKQELANRFEGARRFDFDPFEGLDYFQILGVTRQSKFDELKEAYRKQMKHYHPDRFVSLARKLNHAYETLSDPERRRQYLEILKKS